MQAVSESSSRHTAESHVPTNASCLSISKNLWWFATLRSHKLDVRRPNGVQATLALLSKSLFKLVHLLTTQSDSLAARVCLDLVWDWRVRGDES